MEEQFLESNGRDICKSPQQEFKTLEQDMLTSLKEWLSFQKYLWAPGEMFSFLRLLELSKSKDLWHEIEEICILIDSLISQLLNLFDNNICFYGDTDQEFFEQSYRKAYLGVVSAKSVKKCYHSELSKEIFDMGCKRALQIIHDHNKLICENELKIVSVVKSKVLRELEIVIENIPKNLTFNRDKEFLTRQIQTAFLTVIIKCMDAEGRLSYIETVTIKEFMNLIAEKIAEKFENNLRARDAIKYAVYMYQTHMNEIYEKVTNFDATTIAEKHKEIVDNVIKNLQEADANIARNIFRTQYVNALQMRTEKLQLSKLATVQANNDSKLLCIYLNSQWIQVYTMNEGIPKSLSYENCVKIPPTVAITDSNILAIGHVAQKYLAENKNLNCVLNIEKCIKNASMYDNNSKFILTGLFKKLCLYAKAEFKMEFSKAIILVPAWFGAHHFQVVRDCAEKAGYDEIYMVRESIVAALKILENVEKKSEHSKPTMAASFSIFDNGIYVEIFGQNLKNPRVLKMLAVTFTQFKVSNAKSCKVAAYRNKLLTLAYEKAIDQVDIYRKESNVFCYLLAESDEWKSDFEYFCATQDNIELKNDARDKYALFGGGELSVNPKQIREKIEDCIILDMDNDGQDGDEINTENEELVGNMPIFLKNDEELCQKKEILSGMCMHMRIQMDSGEVKIRKLFQQDVIETLEIAEKIALEKSASSEEVEQQIKDVHEIFQEYNFS